MEDELDAIANEASLGTNDGRILQAFEKQLEGVKKADRIEIQQ